MTNNQQLTEVLCALTFDQEQNEWDSTFFGRYHDLIKQLGYIEKKEKKQVQVQVELLTNKVPSIKEDPSQLQMAFFNPEKKSAVILGKNFISFHKLAPYTSWDDLILTVADPCLAKYQSLGLGNGLKEVQCLYLNKYELGPFEGVTKFFKFLPQIKDSTEEQLSFQGKYQVHDNSIVQIKVNTTGNIGGRQAYFECSSFVINTDSSDFHALSQIAHDVANHAYKEVIKD